MEKKNIKNTKKVSRPKKLDELQVVADTGQTGGNIQTAVQNARNNAKRQGVDDASVVIPPENESVNHEKVYTKGEIRKKITEKILSKYPVYTKAQAIDIIREGKVKGEGFAGLKVMGLFELADDIITTKKQFDELVEKFFDTLYEKGYKYKDIVEVVNKMQLDGFIPKVLMNKIGREIKQREEEAKQIQKQQTGIKK